MARRILLVQRTGDGSSATPYTPNVAGPYTVLASRGNWMLVKVNWNGTDAQTQNTIADLPTTVSATDSQGNTVQVRPVEVNADAIGTAAKAAIKTWLTNQGFDVSQFDADNPADRRLLLRFALRRLFLTTLSTAEAVGAFEFHDGVMVQ